MLQGCGGDNAVILPPAPPAPEVSKPNPNMNFNRVAVFPVCPQVDAPCETAKAGI
jgi:hypothetical protein